MARLPSLVATPLRYGAAIASVSSSVLSRAADRLRSLAGEDGPAPPSPGRGEPAARASSPSGSTAARRSAAGGSRGSGEAGGRSRGRAAASAASSAGDGGPDRQADEERTVGRRHAERTEPSPEPARGSSASVAGSRRPSKPKAARKQRGREAQAETVDDVRADAGSGRGGSPGSPAENTPKERAGRGEGREPAPMGGQDAPETD